LILDERIAVRVEAMLAAGLEAEVRGLLESGVDFETPAMSGLGYREWRAYFEGRATLEEVAELIRRNTRRFARRQAAWFREDDPGIHWFDLDDAGLGPIERAVQAFLEA
jgi:tRNA dimethylallyltransferase